MTKTSHEVDRGKLAKEFGDIVRISLNNGYSKYGMSRSGCVRAPVRPRDTYVGKRGAY